MSERKLAIQVVMLPRDTNPQGSIFGGVLLSHIDLAGAVEARRHGNHTYVTVAMNEVVFRQPVYVGDLVAFYTRTLRRGTTSLTVAIEVEATRAHAPAEPVLVTEATVTYVAVDAQRRPVPVAPLTDQVLDSGPSI